MAKAREIPTPADAVPAAFRTHLHPASMLSALGLAGFIAFVGTLIVRHNDLPLATDLRISLWCAALSAAALAGPLRRLWRTSLEVTPGGLDVRLGTWRARTLTIPLGDICGVDVRSGALGRRLDFGTVTIGVGAEEALIVPHVRAPLALRDALRRAGGRR